MAGPGKPGRRFLGRTARVVAAVKPDLRDAVFKAAADRGQSVVDYVTEVLAREVGYPLQDALDLDEQPKERVA